MERYAEALQDIDTSLKYKPNYFKALRTRARIYVGLELFDPAVEDFSAAVEYGSAHMSEEDLSNLKEEMESTEKQAIQHRQKEKDYYKILGAWPLLFILNILLIPTHYRALMFTGLTRTCRAAEIRKAYLSESLKHHPDKVSCIQHLCGSSWGSHADCFA